jgi:hypothetical protein
MKPAAFLAMALLLTAAAEPAPVVRRIAAEEARQGVAADARHVYAVDNSRIGKYRIADGIRVAHWQGDQAIFPHLNSCTIAGRDLVCASSNYPALPQSSSVELFDPRTLRHRRSIKLGLTDGSLTAVDRHAGRWWAVFAQYDGKGRAPGKNHRATRLVEFDSKFRVLRHWTFPEAVLERLKPYSISGASWSRDGRLAVSGHDLPEIYFVALPEAGTVLRHVATVPVVTRGQAIDWDWRSQGRLWSISRQERQVVLSDLGRGATGGRNTIAGTVAEASSP